MLHFPYSIWASASAGVMGNYEYTHSPSPAGNNRQSAAKISHRKESSLVVKQVRLPPEADIYHLMICQQSVSLQILQLEKCDDKI